MINTILQAILKFFKKEKPEPHTEDEALDKIGEHE